MSDSISSSRSNLSAYADDVQYIHRSISQVNPDDPNERDFEQFSEKNLYPDMKPAEIALRRSQTRSTIISRISERIQSRQGLGDAEKNDEIEDYGGVDDALPVKDDGAEFQLLDRELVTWNGLDDLENPRNWSNGRKWRSCGVASIYTLLGPFASSMLSPAVADISADFGNSKTVISSLMVSVFILAWAVFSPLIAPLSEMYGRRYVLSLSIWFLFVFNIGCALAQNVTQMCIFRLLAGVGACAPVVIGGGVISDLFDNNARGTAMSIYSLGPTVGPCVSALIAGFIAENLGWRWCFWVLVIFNGSVAVAGSVLLQETFGPQILKNKAHKLRKKTGNENLHSIFEIPTGETTFDKFYINLSRPMVMLVTHPMVFGLGLFMAIAYGCLYIMIVTFPDNWGVNYGMNLGIVGLMYVSLLIGYMIGILITNLVAQRMYEALIKKNGGVSKPEYRIPFLLVGTLTLTTGMFWYGWGSYHHLPWIFPAVGATIFSFGVIPVFYCVQNYLIDMNPKFAASSIAAASVFRSYFGFAFPLFAPIMFDRLGYGWGCSIFAFIMLAAGLPFPLFVFFYGEKLRIWANKRTEVSQAKRDKKNVARLHRLQEKEQMQHSSKS